jgi:hypothetical protein
MLPIVRFVLLGIFFVWTLILSSFFVSYSFLLCYLFIYYILFLKSEFCWNDHHNLAKLQSNFFQIKIKIILF